MDFKELLNVADCNKSEAQSEAAVKRYSTTLAPPKKPLRSGVQSDAVVKFLLRKKHEEQQRALEAQKKKEELLTLRSQNTKNSKKAKIMASRTKDNDFSRIRLTEDEVEANKKREAQLSRMALNDKVQRMKARIEMEEKEKLLPRKRKRKSKSDDAGDNCEDIPHPTRDDEETRQKKMSRKERKEMELEAIIAEMAAEKKKKFPVKNMDKKNTSKKNIPQASFTNFGDLLQLASKKQYEPVALPEVKNSDSDNRPRTKQEKSLYYEERARAQRKLDAKSSPMQPVNPKHSTERVNLVKKNKSIENNRVDQNNNAIRKDQKISEQRMTPMKERPPHNDRNNPQAAQRTQKDFQIPKKSVSAKRPPNSSKSERSQFPSHPTPNESSKRIRSPIHPTPNETSKRPRSPIHPTPNETSKRHWSPVHSEPHEAYKNRVNSPFAPRGGKTPGNVQNQMPKPSSDTKVSRPKIAQNHQIKNSTHSVSSNKGVHPQGISVSKPHVNGVNKKLNVQQSYDSSAEKTQRRFNNSSETPSRTEKSNYVQSNKNSKPSFNKESSPPKRQQMKMKNERVDEEETFDLFMDSEETLFRTENGNYVTVSKNSINSLNKGNVPSPSSLHRPPKNVKHVSEERTKQLHSAETKKSKNIPSAHISSPKPCISDKYKEPVNKIKVPKTPPDFHQNSGNRMISSKETPKYSTNAVLKNKNNILPSKSVPPKPPHLSHCASKVANLDNARTLNQKIPNGKALVGKIAVGNRPLSAKPAMSNRTGVPSGRPNISAAKSKVSPKPFHMNPYLDAPRRLLEPQRPPKPPMKRRIESDDDDDDDEDDMSDFIDDGQCFDDTDYSKHIKEIFRYDRSKYIDDDDDDIEETSFAEQMKEEMRSARLGYLEDLEDMKQEEEEKKRKMMKKKRHCKTVAVELFSLEIFFSAHPIKMCVRLKVGRIHQPQKTPKTYLINDYWEIGNEASRWSMLMPVHVGKLFIFMCT